MNTVGGLLAPRLGFECAPPAFTIQFEIGFGKLPSVSGVSEERL
jgi:hypothetical protein